MTNLLLIDDDEVDRKMVLRLLQRAGIQMHVEQAETAWQGLEMFEDRHFDAVLLDYRLPDMPGLEVLGMLVRFPENRSAIIVLTGSTDDDLARQCLEAGAQDFLLKEEISARHLQRALLHSRTRHALEQKLVESHEKFRQLAESDQLTGLANRHFFDKSLRAEILRCHRTAEKVALLLLDLDHFKRVNDTLGHDSGDLLLREVAARLLGVIRGSDTLCRLGGDEFAIIAPGLDVDLSVMKLVQRVQEALRDPFRIGETDCAISGSIGIAITDNEEITGEQLLKHADLAMYRAKRDGRARIHFFSPALQTEVLRKATTEKELRSPALYGQLQLYFQPLLDSASHRVGGAEALIRWNHPEQGLLAPGAFLDVAEEFGLMAGIDGWSRRAACHQMSDWLERGLVDDSFRITFNISASALDQDDLDLVIQADLARAGLPDGAMELEVTENVLVGNFEKSADLLNRIKGFGVGIAVDDFGTGYSSMAYLKRLPASTLKVDRAFLQDVPQSEIDCRILRAMIVMAKSLELRVVVEGIETLEQARLCAEYGADVLQGYFFSKPVPAEEFEARFLAGRAEVIPSLLRTGVQSQHSVTGE